MLYSIVGILAFLIHIIVNIDVLFERGGRDFRGGKEYFFFLLSVLLFHIADGCWGLLYDAKLTTLVYIDTVAYFIGMSFSILLWGVFIFRFLGRRGRFVNIIIWAGYLVFALQIIAIAVNFFYPILFSVSEDCVYSAGILRYGILIFQAAMFVFTSAYTMYYVIKSKGRVRKRYIAIFSFGSAMTVFIILQVVFSLWPIYSLGFLLGVTALHTFVLEDQKAERQRELDAAKEQIAVDALTGMRSKHAYVDEENSIDKLIAKKEMDPFAVIMFDLNGLKTINDEQGHEAGDRYIISATELISMTFPGSAIYRFGGDEFVAILIGRDYEYRDVLFRQFNDAIEENIASGGVIVSSGMSVYNPDVDNTLIQVFNRADENMYARKAELKNRTV